MFSPSLWLQEKASGCFWKMDTNGNEAEPYWPQPSVLENSNKCLESWTSAQTNCWRAWTKRQRAARRWTFMSKHTKKKNNNKLIMKTYKFFPKISHCDNNSILKSLVAAFSSVWLWMSSVVAHLVCAQTRKQTTKTHFWSMWGVFLADSAKPWFFLQSVSMLN